MGDWDLGPDERPRAACVDDFYIGKYEVTQEEWLDVMGTNPSDFKSCSTCPVTNVNYDDVDNFINALNKKAGSARSSENRYRLPTAAEWEFAARSRGKKEIWAGTNIESELGDYAWYGNNSGGRTHLVGQKKPNALGLYDMSGNVWEMCSDWATDRSGGGEVRIIRGGSWGNVPTQSLRTSFRGMTNPTIRNHYMGFRLAVSAR